MHFKQWFILTEAKEDKQLALELADGNQNIINELNTIIPQGRKETDQLTLLAAYYYSKHKDIEEIKREFSAYISYHNNNRMPLITINHTTKEPNSPWNDYVHWTQVIHGHQGEDAYKLTTKQQVTDIDFQNEKPIMTSADGKIRVYKANSPQQCIILGKGKTFCISQPGNRMWQGYRDTKTSTFYFVYDDDPPHDRLGIVVVDRQPNGFELTDKVNRTGTTIDPYTKEITTDPRSYIDYLKSRGIDVTKFKNIPKTPEEIAEDEKLGNQKHDLLWFQQLTFEEKSKYIGRGHMLSNEQFDYLWDTNLKSLLEQYVRTGLQLNKYQVNKIATNRDLKDNYIHNRLINNQQSKNLVKYEYEILNDKQKEKIFDVDDLGAKVQLAIRLDMPDILRSINKMPAHHHSYVTIAASYGSLDVLKYLVDEKGAKIEVFAIVSAALNGHLDVVKYLVDEKHVTIEDAVENAALNGHLDVVKYLVRKGAKIGRAVESATSKCHLNVIKYLVDEKGARIGNDAIRYAISNGHLAVIKYFVDEKKSKIGDFAVENAAKNGHLDVVKYLVDEKGAEIGFFTFEIAASHGHLDVLKYLVGKGAEIGNAVEYAVSNGHLNVIKYLVDEKGAKIEDYFVESAARNGYLAVVKYLIEKGAEIGDAIGCAAYNHHHEIAEYLKKELAKREQNQ